MRLYLPQEMLTEAAQLLDDAAGDVAASLPPDDPRATMFRARIDRMRRDIFTWRAEVRDDLAGPGHAIRKPVAKGHRA